MKKFIIITHPRSASTWTKDFLSGQDEIACLNDIYNGGDAWNLMLHRMGIPLYKYDGNIVEHAEIVFQQLNLKSGCPNVGFEIFFSHIPAIDVMQLIHSEKYKIIFLRRVDWVAAAVSFWIGKKTGQWTFKDKKELKPVVIPEEAIINFGKQYIEPLHDIMGIYGDEKHNFYYESLFQLDSINRLLELTGGTKRLGFRNDETFKQNTSKKLENVLNLKELKDKFNGLYSTQHSS